MAESLTSKHCYVFDAWTLDVSQALLTKDGQPVTLRPKTFEVLLLLVENAGRLMVRETILDSVWPGISITEDSLTQCISEIRTALADGSQRIVKTIPKRGYVFALTVLESPARSIETSQAPFASANASAEFRRDYSGPIVCVLPLANLSGDPAQEYLGDGITEDLIDGLSHFADLSVIARGSSFSFKGRALDVREIGRQLGVDYVVDGSVRKIGSRIRVTAQLVDAQSGVRRWSERFDRDLVDIFAIQDEITQSIVRIVVAHLGHAEGERTARKPAASWTSYDLLIRGEQLLQTYEQTWSTPLLYQARQFFQEAHEADPGNARICANLGHTFTRAHADPLSHELGQSASLERGYDLLSKAVSLDPNLPLARAMLGWTLMWRRDARAGVREFEHSVSLNPNFWDWRHANALIYAGEAQRGLEVVRTHERLDPFHPPHVHAFQGHALFLLERYAESVWPLRDSIRRSPQMLLGHVWLAVTLARLGELEEARALVADVRRRAPRMTLEHWHGPLLYCDPAHQKNMLGALNEIGFD